MINRFKILNAAICAVVLSAAVRVYAQVSSSGPQYDGTGITTDSNNLQYDRTGSQLYFGGPTTANAVFLGGTPIMRMRFGADGYTADQRATQVQDRLNLILGQGPILPSDITTRQEGDDAVVLVKGQLLFTADSATAKYDTETPLNLADEWASRLRSVLPGLTEAK